MWLRKLTPEKQQSGEIKGIDRYIYTTIKSEN